MLVKPWISRSSLNAERNPVFESLPVTLLLISTISLAGWALSDCGPITSLSFRRGVAPARLLGAYPDTWEDGGGEPETGERPVYESAIKLSVMMDVLPFLH